MTKFQELIEDFTPQFGNPDHIKALALLKLAKKNEGSETDQEARIKNIRRLIAKKI